MTEQITIDYSPQQRQIVFHQCNADEILYGGSAGGGKSEAILFDALNNAIRIDNCKIIIFRRTFPDLKRSLIQRSMTIYPASIAKYNQSDKVWTFINGSTIEFAYWDDDSNYTNYQGAEYDFIYWDELTQFKEAWYLYMLSRLRGKKQIQRQVKSATNPGGIGHGWVLSRFIDVEAKPEEIWTPKDESADFSSIFPNIKPPEPMTRCFIPATVFDNPALLQADPAYLMRLMQLPEQERRALLEGDWYSFAGQYFKSFRKHKHVIEPFEIPLHWRKYRSVDWGYNDPCAVYWHATDEDGHTYTYRELYIRETDASDVAKRIVEMSVCYDDDGNEIPEKIEHTVASPDMWQKRGIASVKPNGNIEGETIAEIFLNNGVPVIQADNRRVIGWTRVREELKDAPDGKPYWMIFDGCHNLIRTFPVLVHDTKHVEDVADGQEDHSGESVRYHFMSRPSRSKHPKEAVPTIKKYKQDLIKSIRHNRKRVL